MIQTCHNCKGKEGYQPVLPGTIMITGSSSCHVVDSSGIQRKSDGENNSSGYKGREKDSDLLDAEAYYDGNDAAHNLCSKDGGNIVSSGNRLHARYIGEADSQNDREGAAQLKIPEFDKGEELKQCADSGTKQSSLNKDDPVTGIDAGDSGNDNRRSDTPHDHGNYMLKSQRQCLPERGDAVQLKNGCMFLCDR